jgi:hypothetical protein
MPQPQAKNQYAKLSCPIKGGFPLFFALVDIGARRETPSAGESLALDWGRSVAYKYGEVT